MLKNRKGKDCKERVGLMKTLYSVMVLLLIGAFLFSVNVYAGRELVIADFDSGTKPNNVDGDFGSWEKDPSDTDQSCVMEFAEDDALGDPAGYSIRLRYDVDSPKGCYNGFWMRTSDVDATDYTTLNIYVKGDKEAGYPSEIKLELKDRNRKAGTYTLKGITDKWKRFAIPLNSFRGMEDKTHPDEFVIVFEDTKTRPKKGAIYVDQIYLTNVFDM